MTLREKRDAKQVIKATALLFLVLAEIVDHANSGQTSQDRKGAKRRSRGYHLGTINHRLSIGTRVSQEEQEKEWRNDSYRY